MSESAPTQPSSDAKSDTKPNTASSLEVVKKWLKSRLVNIMSVQHCQVTASNSLIVRTWTGVVANIHLLYEPIRTRAIKQVLHEASHIGIGSLFIVNADLLPQPFTRFEPAEWLMALHALTHERLYAYDIDDNGPKITQVHFEQVGSTGSYIAKYGPNIKFDQLRFMKVSVKPRYIKGDWHITDFGFNAFWREGQRIHHTEYRHPENRETRWRSWSQTTWEQATHHEIPAPPPKPVHARLQESFDLLEVPNDATREEVKAAYRKLALAVHPDTSQLPKHEAESRFRALSEAYEFIREQRKW